MNRASVDSRARIHLMQRKITSAAIVMTLVLACWACRGRGAASVSSQQTNATSATASGELRFKTPDGWVTEQPSSKMRAAQYKLPKAEGDSEDASLVLYYFGP